VVRKSLELTGLFEAELLVELVLRFWHHPLADDRDFRNGLLERTAEALRQAASGVQIMEDVDAENTNFVAALWFAEWTGLQYPPGESTAGRQRWLDAVRRAMPSCFCNPDDLSP